jgi:hypothetical protein
MLEIVYVFTVCSTKLTGTVQHAQLHRCCIAGIQYRGNNIKQHNTEKACHHENMQVCLKWCSSSLYAVPSPLAQCNMYNYTGAAAGMQSPWKLVGMLEMVFVFTVCSAKPTGTVQHAQLHRCCSRHATQRD